MARAPTATYRVQLRPGFGFAEAAAIADYLAALGVSHLYCSPYLQAAPGSTHGYDVVDPQRVNDELGGAPAHAEMTGALRAAGLGQVLDIVPNHMSTDSANRWWWDVLENGPASPHAAFFDIDWEEGGQRSAFTVLVPVLGDHYGRVLEAGELRVARVGGDLVVRYHDHELPVSPRTADGLLAAAARRAGSAELAAIADRCASLPTARLTDHAAVTERHTRKLALAEELSHLCAADPGVAAAVDAEIGLLNHDPDRLDALLRRQNYQLAHWRTASEELDYRRFVNIETLVGVRTEDPDVFTETHRLIVELVREGTVDGLRVDHVDGLRDPAGYLHRLADATDGAYTVVEKILERGEALPATWPVAGTSGYDFIARATNLFVAHENAAAMTDAYVRFTGETADYAEVVRAAKHHVMAEDLRVEVDRVTGLLAAVCDDHRRHRDHTRRELRHAVRELAASFPVYRTYLQPGRPGFEPSAADRHHVEVARADAAARSPDVDAELFGFLADLVLGAVPGEREAELAARFQQLTAPVMAKGVEDTAFYRYHRLVSLNEVGGDPGTFGRPVADFHHATAQSAARWPRSMLTLSTHDTKRSADVRARIHVLAEIPEAWSLAVERWADRHRRGGGKGGEGWPDRNAEYLLYQTLVGAWPLDVERAVAFMTKATREAKVHTSWVHPDAGYDEAVTAFVRAVLADEGFVADLEGFLASQRLVERGRQISLAQTALLLTCPGVPDLYQGDELWNLHLVDPDNRRPVDFDERRRLLAALREATGADACHDHRSDAPKLWLIQRLLHHRQQHPKVYEAGSYVPLDVSGARAGQAVAFARDGLAVVAPCRTDGDWRGATVDLPPGHWTALATGTAVDGGRARLDELVAPFPVAVLVRDP